MSIRRGPLVVALTLLGVLVLAPAAVWARALVVGGVPSGLRVEGRALPTAGAPRATVRERAEAVENASVVLLAGDARRARRRRELGFRVDRSALLGLVVAYGRSGSPTVDLADRLRAWAGEADLAFDREVDEDALTEAVAELARELDREPSPPIVLESGRVERLGQDGRRLEQAAAADAIRQALLAGRRTVALPVERIPFVAEAHAMAPPRPLVVGRFGTRLSARGAERDRAHNVRTAAGYLDGAVIPPRSRLSFNDRVGARGRAEGYRLAHVILAGEMVDGLGGGVCQVASTLHAAAFLAGLEVVEHSPHSRPSAYIEMGLDATVVWPTVDLVLANPYDFPITVRSWVGEGRMNVELLGARAVPRAEWRRRVLSTEEFSARYVEDPSVPPGEERVTQRGILGYVVLRERTVLDGRRVRLEETTLVYPPTDRVVHVAPGELPATYAGVPDNPY